jgi:hypothetical protein
MPRRLDATPCVAVHCVLGEQIPIVSLDCVYDCHANRKAIFDRGMVPNINENKHGRKATKRGRKRLFDAAIFKERFRNIERCVRLGGQVPPRADSIRAHQRRALHPQYLGLHDDQPEALLRLSPPLV